MKERIQKILARRGVASRRKAEELIEAGRVRRNGEICRLGDSADPDTDEISIDGEPLPAAEGFVYIMLNKPRGVVTTMSDERGRKTVASLVRGCGARVYPVGRLDMDSEGLLLMTNDGQLANRLMHPRHEAKKTYHVRVLGFSPEALTRLGQSVTLDGCRICPPEIAVLVARGGRALLAITIHEGKNRQIRRMCAIAGMEVTQLRRVAEGGVCLGELQSGQWRRLTAEEVETLKK